jgi:hypothetical protein
MNVYVVGIAVVVPEREPFEPPQFLEHRAPIRTRDVAPIVAPAWRSHRVAAATVTYPLRRIGSHRIDGIRGNH